MSKGPPRYFVVSVLGQSAIHMKDKMHGQGRSFCSVTRIITPHLHKHQELCDMLPKVKQSLKYDVIQYSIP